MLPAIAKLIGCHGNKDHVSKTPPPKLSSGKTIEMHEMARAWLTYKLKTGVGWFWLGRDSPTDPDYHTRSHKSDSGSATEIL